MSTKIDFLQKEHVAYITFYEEDEKHPCTLDYKVLDILENTIDTIFKNKENFRAVVVQSKSPKYFVVGANIKALQQLTPENIEHWVKNGHRIFNKLQELPMPVIAKVEGYALGGGLELAMACDMIFAADTAHFGQPEASLGVIPGWGGSARLPNKIGLARAKELFFTGKIISAAEAYDIGLINHVAPKDKLDELITQTLDAIKKNDKLAISYIKQIVNNSFSMLIEKNRFDEATASSVCLYSPGTKKRLEDFFSSRKK